jgi:hypothetical protein
VIWPRRTELATSVRSSAVVVRGVLGQHGSQVSLPKISMRSVSSVSGCQYESLGETVRSGTARRDLHGLDTRVSHDSVEGRGELTSPVADEESELGRAVAEVHQILRKRLLGGLLNEYHQAA